MTAVVEDDDIFVSSRDIVALLLYLIHRVHLHSLVGSSVPTGSLRLHWQQ